MTQTEGVGQGLGELAVEKDQVPVLIRLEGMIVGLADVKLYPGIAQAEVHQHVDQDGVGQGDGGREADEAADVSLLTPDFAGGLLYFRKGVQRRS